MHTNEILHKLKSFYGHQVGINRHGEGYACIPLKEKLITDRLLQLKQRIFEALLDEIKTTNLEIENHLIDVTVDSIDIRFKIDKFEKDIITGIYELTKKASYLRRLHTRLNTDKSINLSWYPKPPKKEDILKLFNEWRNNVISEYGGHFTHLTFKADCNTKYWYTHDITYYPDNVKLPSLQGDTYIYPPIETKGIPIQNLPTLLNI